MDLQLADDFKEFLRLLNSHQVRYLLIGGFAVSYHGYPRSTNDIDVWIEMSDDNASKVVSAIEEFGFSIPELTTELFVQPDKIIRMGVPPMRIEVLTSISGVEFDTCYSARIKDSIDGVPVNLIGLKHLKENKKASGRHKTWMIWRICPSRSCSLHLALVQFAEQPSSSESPVSLRRCSRSTNGLGDFV